MAIRIVKLGSARKQKPFSVGHRSPLLLADSPEQPVSTELTDNPDWDRVAAILRRVSSPRSKPAKSKDNMAG